MEKMLHVDIRFKKKKKKNGKRRKEKNNTRQVICIIKACYESGVLV